MSGTNDTVFLFDVDNTCSTTTSVQDDLRQHIEEEYGPLARDRYWAIFEELRGELGYADYLGALERYRVEQIHDPTCSGCRAGSSTIRSRAGSTRGARKRCAHAHAVGSGGDAFRR